VKEDERERERERDNKEKTNSCRRSSEIAESLDGVDGMIVIFSNLSGIPFFLFSTE